MITIDKQPSEDLVYGIDFADEIASGVSLSSITWSAKRLDTLATDNTVLQSTTGTVSGTEGRCKIIDGVDGVDYQLTSIATLSDGNVLEDEILMRVRER